MATPDSLPSRESVGAELGCARVPAVCSTPHKCWPRGRCQRSAGHNEQEWGRKRDVEPDPRGQARTKDTAAIKRKLFSDPECWACGRRASDGHHILWRSDQGDDVPENIAPLCHTDHMLLHHGIGRDAVEVRKQIGRKLLRERPESVSYVLGKLGDSQGAAYLSRRYFVGGKELRRVRDPR